MKMLDYISFVYLFCVYVYAHACVYVHMFRAC